MEFEPVIGLEVHLELATDTKLFCSCSTRFGAGPNTQTCPICLGMPGALPVFNKKALDFAIKTGLAFNSHIAQSSSFDRKNYYYPDLPKAYQNTQYYQPICKGGYIDIGSKVEGKRIRINRIHIEEDAGKLIHDSQEQETRIDYNRAGIPLLEVVTEPDFGSCDDVETFLNHLRLTAIYLGVSDCKMEEGSLRCDVNISVRPKTAYKLGARVEIKNLNSFKAIRHAIKYEFSRHEAILARKETIKTETRRWNENTSKTESMENRDKSIDYRYFPDPDLPALFVEEKTIDYIRSGLPELPSLKYKRLIGEYGLDKKDADLLISIPDLVKYFEDCIAEYGKPRVVCNWLTGDFLGLINESMSDIKTSRIRPKMIKNLLQMIDQGLISSTIAGRVFERMFHTGESPEAIVEKDNLHQVSNDKILESIVSLVLEKNKGPVRDYMVGKKKAISYLMGQAMEAMDGKANPLKLKEMIEKKLEES